jgi:hypothetical protein
MKIKTPQKFEGLIGWAEIAHSSDASVDRAILRSSDELVIDFSYEGRRYTATLRRVGGNEFRGKYATQYQGKPYEGVAVCRIFTGSDGIFLFGRWTEDNQSYIWWTDLNSVEHFSDENF